MHRSLHFPSRAGLRLADGRAVWPDLVFRPSISTVQSARSRPSCPGRHGRLDECVERLDLSVDENRDVHPASDGRSSGRAGLPAQAAEVMNHLCGADQAEREARRALAENAPDPIRDGCLADGLSIRVVERAIAGIQLGDCAPAAIGIPFTEDLGHVPLHKVSERRHRGAHDSHGGEGDADVVALRERVLHDRIWVGLAADEDEREVRPSCRNGGVQLSLLSLPRAAAAPGAWRMCGSRHI